MDWHKPWCQATTGSKAFFENERSGTNSGAGDDWRKCVTGKQQVKAAARKQTK
jgi:hypothetical protein